MSTITTLNSTDSGSTSRGVINTNFSNLNTDKAESSTVTAHTGASSGVHGVTGSVVGTTDTQTLTNKTLTSPTITNKSSTGTDSGAETLQNKTISGANNTLTIRESDLSLSDNTTNNASTSKHGFLKKLDNDTTHFLRGDGSWEIPPGNGIPYVASASDNLKQSADTERNNRGNTYSGPFKSVMSIYSGVIRIKYDLRSDVGGNTVYGKLYKNGVAVGTERSTSSDSYTTYSEDIYVGAGDTVELWTKTTNVSTEYAYIRNFRLYYDVAISNNDLVITN